MQNAFLVSFLALRDQVVGRIWLRAPVADATLTRWPASQVRGGSPRSQSHGFPMPAIRGWSRGQGGEDGVLGGRPPHVLQNLLHRGGRRAGGQHHALPGLGAHPWRRKRGALTGAPFSTSGPFLPHSEPRPTLGLARQRPASPVPQFPRGGTQGRREIAWAHAPGRGDRGAAASASGRSAAPPPGREAHFLSPPTTLKGVAPRAGCAVRAGPGAGWEELQPQPPSTQGVGVGSRPGFPRCVTKHPKPSFLQVGDTAHNPRRCRGNNVPVHARWPGAQCALSERQLLARWPGTQDACQHLSCRIWVRVASLTSKTPSLLDEWCLAPPPLLGRMGRQARAEDNFHVF